MFACCVVLFWWSESNDGRGVRTGRLQPSPHTVEGEGATGAVWTDARWPAAEGRPIGCRRLCFYSVSILITGRVSLYYISSNN